MAKIKKTLKKIGRQIWELFKSSIPAALIYFCAGAVLMMLTLGDGTNVKWETSKLIWTIVCAAAAIAYNALLSFAQGGNAYEMLVSGNIKRNTADMYGEGYKISTHKEAKEYRSWKGFAIGGFMAIYTLVFGIVLGCNQAEVDAVATSEGAWTWYFLLSVLFSGWSTLPFFYLNASGYTVSYFVSCAFAIIPVLVSGFIYIAGAYARRNKAIRAQELADKASAAEASKEKKINYGGLPGTKPRKRK